MYFLVKSTCRLAKESIYNNMNINCTQNTETGAFNCEIPFPKDGDIEYNNIVSPEGSMICIVLILWFFAWTLERLFYYITNRSRKATYDS